MLTGVKSFGWSHVFVKWWLVRMSRFQTRLKTAWTLCVGGEEVYFYKIGSNAKCLCSSFILTLLSSFATACPCAVRLCVSLSSTRTYTHPNVSIAGRSEGVCVRVHGSDGESGDFFENMSVSSCDSAQICFTRCIVVKPDPHSASSYPHACQTAVFTPVLTKDFNPADKRHKHCCYVSNSVCAFCQCVKAGVRALPGK